jgi:hypothetical protein
MVNIDMFCEGDAGLRQGFSSLFNQVKGNNVKLSFIACGGKDHTVTKFKSGRSGNSNKILLIDLDESENKRETCINNMGLKPEGVFFMVQEMEAWFLSQPEILEKHYSKEVSAHLPKGHAKDIAAPAKELKARVAKFSLSANKEYHKVKDAVALLQKIDIHQLCKDFTDVEKLVASIAK